MSTVADKLNAIHDSHRTDMSPALVRLREQAYGKYVPHSGRTEDPVVAFVGEAPGRNEHITGEPFVGAAGRVLNELLEGIGLKRNRCYITNAVHYRPVDKYGQNRRPDPDEVLAARQYLIAELEAVRPTVVATLGNVPLQALVDTRATISTSHGMVARVDLTPLPWVPIITLYHPAVGVYQRSMKPALHADMSKLAMVLRHRGIEL